MDERDTLRKQNRRHQHFGTGNAHLLAVFLAAFLQLVPGRHIVMAFHIIDSVSRMGEHRLHSNIRTAAAQTVLHDIKQVDCPGAIALDTDLVGIRTSLDNIPEAIGEMSDIRHLCIVGNTGTFSGIQKARHIPALAINHEIRIECFAGFIYRIDGCHIQNSHQIEAEAVNMIGSYQIGTGIHNIFMTHVSAGIHIISAIGTI